MQRFGDFVPITYGYRWFTRKAGSDCNLGVLDMEVA